MSASDVVPPSLTEFSLPNDMDFLMDADLDHGRKCVHFILMRIASTPATAGTRRQCGDRWVIDPTPRSYRVEMGWGFVDAFLYTEDYEVIITLRERQHEVSGEPYWGMEYLRIRRLRYRKLKTGDRHMMLYHYQHGNHPNDTQAYNEMISHEKYLPMMNRIGNHLHMLGNWW